MTPQIQYARNGDINIAYQVVGSGPRDLVLVPGWVSNIEVFWEEPTVVRFLERLASFSRLILLDKRGTGLSDRVSDIPSLEQRMDDVRAVMDAVGSRQAALFGYSEGGPMCILFAATHPDRATALIMAGSYPNQKWSPESPWGRTPAMQDQMVNTIAKGWGGPVGIEARAPSVVSDERFRQWWARWLRSSASPAAAVSIIQMSYEIDVRDLLPFIHTPTLILHSVGDKAVSVGGSRFIAEHIPGAKLVELPGSDHLPWLSDSDAIVDEIEEFLTGVRGQVEPDRVLATVLFTDVVGSTDKAAQLGDRRWRDLLDSHNSVVRREIARFRGHEVKTAGDGFLATFDGPARGIRCARAISDAVRLLGLETRAGLHTGECEVMGDDIGGIAVHIGARVAAQAGASEVLVSSTVKDLVAGSGLEFQERGLHSLKGIPGEWRLFALER
jgi:pimeloyl-ACP methyl ester carboxylesterase